MRTFKLVVEYDGTGFRGWQIQPGLRTVQGCLEEGLAMMFPEAKPAVAGAGRTDAGVHARGQVGSFSVDTPLPARAIAALLDRRLPQDLRVREVQEAEPGFHARHSARARGYSYRLLRGPDLLAERFAWAPPGGFDPGALARATRVLEVEADFSAFRNSGSSPADPRCRVHRAGWSADEGGVRLDIVADHFLYRMVRNVVGTALAVARSSDPAGAMADILASRDRGRAGVSAPPQGLCFERVFYDASGREDRR